MDFLTLCVTLVALPLGVLVLRTVYHLYFHPLSRFPGPKIAAATFLYEFYYDVIKSGMYIWEIERMHEKYGEYIELHRSIDFRAYRKAIHITSIRCIIN